MDKGKEELVNHILNGSLNIDKYCSANEYEKKILDKAGYFVYGAAAFLWYKKIVNNIPLTELQILKKYIYYDE